MLIVAGIAALLLLIIVPATVKLVWQYEAGGGFRLGRLQGTRPPGIRIMIPFVDIMRKVDTRVVVINVPAQEVITKDNVTLKVDAIIFFRVLHPESSIIEVADFRAATLQLRYLQTLTTIATEKTNTIVFPLPMDILSAFLERAKRPS